MKKLYLFAALAAMLAACSENDLTKDTAMQNAEEGAVMFDAYTQRGVTRAGQTGIMDNDKLKLPVDLTNQNGGGFGVFGYYTDNNDYEQSRMPDFMYNQLVEWTGSYWKYEPIKYWPNEYGSSAISDDADKVTFFAYAPYVETNGSGKIERSTGDDLTSYGITGLSRNSNQGDPIVKYIASFERDKSVDLLWGIVGTAEADNWNLTNGGKQTNLEVGKPWLNVMRPAEAATQASAIQRVKFTFAHALTQLTMNIDAIVDEITKGSNTLADGTNIYVRQLSMTGVALKGALNLNNTETKEYKALWLDYNGLADIESGVPVVLYDGRKDGKEGVAGATASNEKIIGFNPNIISDDGNNTVGVTATPTTVFADDPVMLIPTGENMELEIIYDVETADRKLPTLLSDGKTPGSSIENRVRKTINFPENGIANGLENGKHYTINLHLGMNSVKFDVAEVKEWTDDNNTPNVDLPSNGSATVASATDVAHAALANFDPFPVLAYDVKEYKFAVGGLTPGESITKYVASTSTIDALNNSEGNVTNANVIVGSSADYSASDDKADANGKAYVKVTLPGNPYIHNLAASNNYILIEGQTSLKGWKARFAYTAHPIGLTVASVANSGDNDVITLSAPNVDGNSLKTNGSWDPQYGALTTNAGTFVTMKVNDSPITLDATPAADKFTYAAGVLTIGKHLIVGDKVAITITALDDAGNPDGATDKVEFTIGGISFVGGQTITYHGSGTQTTLEPTWKGAEKYTGLTYTKIGSGSFYSLSGDQITTSDDGAEANTIQCVAAFNADATKKYFYTSSSCTAKYDLTVTEQSTTTIFASATEIVPGVLTAVNSSIDYDATVAVTGDVDGLLSTPTVEYAITKVMLDGVEVTGDNYFEITPGTGALKVHTALTESKNYEVTITCTYPDTNGYNTSSGTKKISVQTVGF